MKSTAMRRIAAVVAGAAVAALTLSGCVYAAIEKGGTTSSGATGPVKTPVATGVAANLVDFYSQKLEWKDCSEDQRMDCTTVRAPLDYAHPQAGEIKLAVVRMSTKNALGSLLANPGGPGGSGYDLVKDSGTTVFSADLRAKFDVIGFDPRGVGRSTAVKCYDGADMDKYLYDLPKNARGSAAWQTETDDRAAAFAKACADNSGELLKHITTEDSARDMDLLRGVLGDEKLNYLGFSYGTFLGATYAKLFPEKVGRLVLDGAIDPSIPSADVGKIQAVGFEKALRAYMQDCLKGRSCMYSGTVDQALSDLGVLLAELDRNPLPLKDGRKLGADAAFTGIVVTMYSQQSWPMLTQALTDAAGGNGESLMYLADVYNARTGPGAYSDNSTEAFNAYNCMDYPDDLTDAQTEEIKAYVKQNAPTIAPYWSGGDTCKKWAYPATGTRGAITAEGAAPILVIGTTNDPATPYEWAQSLAKQLSSGVMLTRVGEGHTAYGKGNSCIDSAVDKFLITGEAPANNTTCK